MRHGQTAANESRIFCGRLNPPLSPQGEAGVRAAAQALGASFDQVLISNMLRAQQTARIVCPEVQLEVAGALREIDFGDFEGLTAEQIERRMPEPWARYIADPQSFIFPGGDDAAQYIHDAAQTALSIAQGNYNRVLVVSHKGWIAAALSALLHGSVSHMFHYDIRPAGFAKLRVTDGFAVLQQLY